MKQVMKQAAVAVVAVAVVLAAAALADAGRRGGPGKSVKTLPGQMKDVFHITFQGGEKAAVLLVGDGATDLDLFIYDSAGRLVSRQDGPTDIEGAVWVPNRTEVYRVEVHNLGTTWNRYVLQTN
jgi:hypothetical protein